MKIAQEFRNKSPDVSELFPITESITERRQYYFQPIHLGGRNVCGMTDTNCSNHGNCGITALRPAHFPSCSRFAYRNASLSNTTSSNRSLASTPAAALPVVPLTSSMPRMPVSRGGSLFAETLRTYHRSSGNQIYVAFARNMGA